MPEPVRAMVVESTTKVPFVKPTTVGSNRRFTRSVPLAAMLKGSVSGVVIEYGEGVVLRLIEDRNSSRAVVSDIRSRPAPIRLREPD